MRRFCVVVASATLLVMGAPAVAYVPDKTPRRAAEAATIQASGAAPALPGTSAFVIMRGGKVIAGINPDRPMVPASLLKLATTTTAITRLGPRFAFTTTVRADTTGATVPTLYLVGGGDPTFATEAYRRHRFLPKPSDRIKRPAFASGSPTVEDLARAVAATGLRHVTGDLVADDSAFDTARTQPGWRPSYTGVEPDIGLLSGLTLNEGRADLAGHRNVASPAMAAGNALVVALRAQGVSVDGAVRRGRASASSIAIARVASPPLAEIVDFCLRYSINLDAEFMLKWLGGGTTAGGVALVRKTLTELGVSLDGFVMADGSGLSVRNRITPRSLSTLVEVIRTHRGAAFDVLRAAIPVAGEPGTLLTRMRMAPTGHNLRGKTGLIRHVRTMTGWVTASDGVPVVYVAMYSGVARALALTGPLNLFGLALALLPGA